MRILILALWAVSLSAYASGLDQLKAFLSETKTARGSFVQTVTAKSGRKPQQSQGFFAISRPGKFRWSYDPDLKQVTVKKLGQAIGASPAALLAGEALEANFVLKDAGAVEGLEFIEAVPKAQDSTFERLRIGFKDRLPRVMEVHDNFGQTTLLYLNQFETNVAMSPALFHFSPPKGADVVGE